MSQIKRRKIEVQDEELSSTNLSTSTSSDTSNTSKENEINSLADLPKILQTVDPQWKSFLKSELEKPYFKKLLTRLIEDEKQGLKLYPPPNQVLSLFQQCNFDNIKVVILGQDPYHGAGQAHGLCFSVNKGIPTPPSLKNMYKELEKDIPNFKTPKHGYLKGWLDQGVFLLNAVLTVKESTPNFHKGIGWETFTKATLKYISDNKKDVVFIFWGNYAQKAGEIVDSKRHHILKGAHPSPLSVKKFFGCKHFSLTNSFLKSKEIPEIDWSNLP